VANNLLKYKNLYIKYQFRYFILIHNMAYEKVIYILIKQIIFLIKYFFFKFMKFYFFIIIISNFLIIFIKKIKINNKNKKSLKVVLAINDVKILI